MRVTRINNTLTPKIRKINSQSAKNRSENRCKRKSKTCHTWVKDPGNDFLKHEFTIIPLAVSDPRLEVSIEDRDYFFECFSNYLGLSGNKLNALKTDNYELDLNILCNEFQSQLPNGVYLNIDKRGDELFPVIYATNNAFDYSFCFIPVSVIDKLSPKVGRLFIEFIAYLCRSQGIYTALDSDHQEFDWVLNEDPEAFWYDDELETYNKLVDDIDIYKSGSMKSFIEMMIQCTWTRDDILINASILQPYAEPREKRLIKIIKSAVRIFSTDHVLSYDYDPSASDSELTDGYWEDELTPVEIRLLFGVVWDLNDGVVSTVCDNLNAQLRECSSWGLVQYMELKPNNEKEFRTSRYPYQFEDVIQQLIEAFELWEE